MVKIRNEAGKRIEFFTMSAVCDILYIIVYLKCGNCKIRECDNGNIIISAHYKKTKHFIMIEDNWIQCDGYLPMGVVLAYVEEVEQWR